MSPQALKWIVALSFFAFGVWALKPDTLDENQNLRGTGVFITTLIAFFIVEMGDKTQLATIALAARYDSLITVVMGTTLGMMIANVPACMGWRKVNSSGQHEGGALGGGGLIHSLRNSGPVRTDPGSVTSPLTTEGFNEGADPPKEGRDDPDYIEWPSSYR